MLSRFWMSLRLLRPAGLRSAGKPDACVTMDDYATPISRIGRFCTHLWLRFARPWMKTLANRMPARLAVVISAIHRRFASFTYANFDLKRCIGAPPRCAGRFSSHSRRGIWNRSAARPLIPHSSDFSGRP
jgi:hypothetical protein